MAEPAREPACREVVELVTEYLDEALPAGRRDAVERHLGGCAGCAAFVGRVRTAIRVAAAVGVAKRSAAIPSGVRDRLLRTYRLVVAGDAAGVSGGA
jgi:anti-sigma factor RsiW